MSDKALLASDTMVARVGKLLRQAEDARERGAEGEAEVYMEKALKLSQAYSIDVAVARAQQAKKERVEVPEKRSFTVGDMGSRNANRNKHFADLMIAICDANDIEVTIFGNAVWVHGYGFPSDLDMAERLFALLSVQMVQEADAGLKRGDNGEVRLAPKRVRVELAEDDRPWGEWDGTRDEHGYPVHSDSCYYDDRDEYILDGMRSRYSSQTYRNEWVKSYPPPRFKNVETGEEEKKWVSTTDARVWRTNFYLGFVSRTQSRLREAKRLALKDAGVEVGSTSDSRAVALRDKAKEVREFYEEEARYVLAHGGTYGGASTSRHDSGGQIAGQDAASRAVIGNEKDLR